MKMFRKIMMAMFAIAALGMTAACEKESDDNNGSGVVEGTIVGHWTVDRVTLDGEYWNPTGTDMETYIFIEADGTGSFTFQKNTGNFTWSLDGTALSLQFEGVNGSYEYTVTELTDTTAFIVGDIIPVVNISGAVKMHMVKAGTNPGGENPGGENPGGENPGGEDPGDEPGGDPAEFPGGTNWAYSETVTLPNIPMPIAINATLTFAATGNNGNLTVNVPGIISENADFTYTYSATTQEGLATGNMFNSPNVEIAFRYNSTDDVMTVVLPEEVASRFSALSSDIPTQIDFVRAD